MINETLYRFNKQKLNKLLKLKQFSFLLFHFLEDPKGEKEVFKKSFSTTSDKAFVNLIKELKKICFQLIQSPGSESPTHFSTNLSSSPFSEETKF